MRFDGARIGILFTVLCLLWPAVGRPQQSAGGAPAQPTEGKKSTAKSEPKASLADLTRVSTDKAAKTVTQEKSRRTEVDESLKDSGESGVTELRPAPQAEAQANDAAVVSSKDAKRRTLDKVHGTVYGSLDPKNKANRRTGAAVGAGSKAGNTSVYVEADHTRQTSPPIR